MIRLATAADLPALRHIEAQSATAAHWREVEYQRLLAGESPRLALVIEEAGALEGFLIAQQIGPEWELENIVIQKSAHRRGLASALLSHFVDLLRREKAGSVFLEVRASNAAARALYKKHGFVETGHRRNYYENPSEDAILYRFLLMPPTAT